MDNIKVGDSIRTKYIMLLVEARHPDSGQQIDTMFPRWHRLTVCGVDNENSTVDVTLPDGFIATIDRDSVEIG